MGLTDVVAILRAETGDFTAKIDAAAVQLKGLSSSGESSMGKLSAALGSIPLPVVAVAAGITLVAAGAIDLAAKMETVDNKIAASAGISTASGKQIGDALLNASIGTTISGQQMGTAYAGVAAQLGLTEGHALSFSQAAGIMKAATDLSEASGTDLGTATSALAGTMQAYGLKAKDATGVTNDLYNTAKLTGTGVGDVSGTLAKLHSTLGTVTPSVSDVSGLMVDLAQHGETGRKALAAVNTSLNGLLTPSAAAAKAQKDLGISVFDASGKFVGMSALFGELKPKLAGMTQEQQLATLKSIGFGTASKAMLDTIMAGPAAFDAASAAVSKSGSAHEAAGKATQGLSESWKKIVVAAKDVGTLLGEKLLPVVEKVAKSLADFAGAVVKDWPTISAVIKYAIDAIKPIFETFAGWIKSFIQVIQGIIEFVKGVFTGNWTEAWNGIKKIFGGFLDAILALPKAALDAIFNLFHTSWAKIGADINSAWSTIANFFTGLWATIIGAIHTAWSAVINFFTGLWTTISGGITAAWNAIASVFTGIWTTISGAITTAWNAVVAFFTTIWTNISGNITAAWNAIASVFTGVWTTISSAITTVWNNEVAFFTGIWSTISGAATSAWNAVVSFLAGIWAKISGDITAAWNAVVSFFGSLWSKISTALGDLGSSFYNFMHTAFERVKDAFTDAWNDVSSWLSGMKDRVLSGLGNIGDWLYNAGKAIIQGLINGVESLGQKAVDAVKKIGSDIKNAVTSGFGLFSPSKVFYGYGQNMMQGLANGINTTAPAALDAMSKVVQSLSLPIGASVQTSGSSSGLATIHNLNAPNASASGQLGTSGNGFTSSPTIIIQGSADPATVTLIQDALVQHDQKLNQLILARGR